MTNISKELTLFAAGILANIFANLLLAPTYPDRDLWVLTLIAIMLILILYGLGIISRIYHEYNLWVRKGNRLIAPKVGILSDSGWNPKNRDIYSWTDISPEEWRKEIEKLAKENKVKVKVKLIDVDRNFDTYIAILNPYGGVYPEGDIKNFRTLSKIFNYVNEGGLFVNVADIPGYWAYHPLLERRLETPSPIYVTDRAADGSISIIPLRPFELTPFMKELGLRVFKIEKLVSGEGGTYIEPLTWDVEFIDKNDKIMEKLDKIEVHRVVVVEKNVESIIEPKKLFEQVGDVSPFFFVKYGEGKFLISLVFESYRSNSKMKEVLAGSIIKYMKEIKKSNIEISY